MIYPAPKPQPKVKAPKRPKTRSRMRAVNPERRAKMHARNFPPRPAVEPWCYVTRLAQRRGGAPASWSPCAQKIDAAHVVARGMGGVNSGAHLVVYLCRNHHHELDTRGRPSFESRYGCDLMAEAARQASETDKDI